MIYSYHIKDTCRAVFYCMLLTVVVLTLYACPFSSVYKLDNEATIPVDETLLGKWSAMMFTKQGDLQPVKMILSKKNDNEYYICFTGNWSDLRPYKLTKNDSIQGTAFMSNAVNRQFLNIEIKGQTYISLMNYQNDTLSLLPLEDGFTAKYIKSNRDLRNAVEVHFKTRIYPRLDEQFSLNNMVRAN